MSCHHCHPQSNHMSTTPDELAIEDNGLCVYGKEEQSDLHSPVCNAEQPADRLPAARDCQIATEALSDTERRVRKRAQNRVAQRSYRNRMKQKVLELEQELCAMRAQMHRQSISYNMSTSPASPGSSYVGQNYMDDARRYSESSYSAGFNSYLPIGNLPFRPKMDNGRIQNFTMGPESLFSTSDLADYVHYGTEGF